MIWDEAAPYPQFSLIFRLINKVCREKSPRLG